MDWPHGHRSVEGVENRLYPKRSLHARSQAPSKNKNKETAHQHIRQPMREAIKQHKKQIPQSKISSSQRTEINTKEI